jgi:hypothetical protein
MWGIFVRRALLLSFLACAFLPEFAAPSWSARKGKSRQSPPIQEQSFVVSTPILTLVGPKESETIGVGQYLTILTDEPGTAEFRAILVNLTGELCSYVPAAARNRLPQHVEPTGEFVLPVSKSGDDLTTASLAADHYDALPAIGIMEATGLERGHIYLVSSKIPLKFFWQRGLLRPSDIMSAVPVESFSRDGIKRLAESAWGALRDGRPKLEEFDWLESAIEFLEKLEEDTNMALVPYGLGGALAEPGPECVFVR